MKATLPISIVAVSLNGFAMPGIPAGETDQLLAQYYSIHRSPASDSLNGVAASVAELAKISRQAAATKIQAKTQLSALSDAAQECNAADLKPVRNWFGDLSDKRINYLKASGSKANPPYQFYCAMVKKHWLQPHKATRNPYYGKSMITCGWLIRPEKADK